MKISGRDNGEFWVKGESLTVSLFCNNRIKIGNQVQADRIPAGPSAKPTSVPWHTMQEGLPMPRRADDESLTIPSVFPKWFIIPSIVWASLTIRGVQNQPVTFPSKKTTRSLVNNVGFFSLNWLFWVISLFGVPGSPRESSSCAFCQRRAAMLCSEPSQKSVHISWLSPGSFVGTNGQRGFSNSRKWNGSWIQLIFYLSSLKNFISQLLCPTENTGGVLKNTFKNF